MQAALGISQPAVSKHLKQLEDAGLIAYKRDGLWVNYYLSDGSGSPYVATLLGNLKHWLEESEEISALVETLPNINREEICNR
jgi:ArsR family transcriptional regulator